MGLALDELKVEEETMRIQELDVMIEMKIRHFVTGKLLDYFTDGDRSGFIFLSDPRENSC